MQTEINGTILRCNTCICDSDPDLFSMHSRSCLSTSTCLWTCSSSLGSRGRHSRSFKAEYRSQMPHRASERGFRRGIWSIRDDLYVPSYSCPLGEATVQDPPPFVLERFQKVISQLFHHRIIRCGGPIEDDMANFIVAQLLYLDAADPKQDIVMYVNSPGGSVTAGMAIFDTMKHIQSDVSTVCVGLAASMGAFLLSAGTTGKRYSLPNARIMIHQPIGRGEESEIELEIQGYEILHHKAILCSYLAYHTGQSIDKIDEDTERDYFMSAKEAVEYGIIDRVIMNPPKGRSLF